MNKDIMLLKQEEEVEELQKIAKDLFQEILKCINAKCKAILKNKFFINKFEPEINQKVKQQLFHLKKVLANLIQDQGKNQKFDNMNN